MPTIYISGAAKGEIGAFCEYRPILIFSYTLDPDLSKNTRYPIFWALLCYFGGLFGPFQYKMGTPRKRCILKMFKLKNGLDSWIEHEKQMKKKVWFVMFRFLLLEIMMIEISKKLLIQHIFATFANFNHHYLEKQKSKYNKPYLFFIYISCSIQLSNPFLSLNIFKMHLFLGVPILYQNGPKSPPNQGFHVKFWRGLFLVKIDIVAVTKPLESLLFKFIPGSTSRMTGLLLLIY